MQIEEFSCGKIDDATAPRVISIDCIFYYYLSKELRLCTFYEVRFCKTQKSQKFRFILLPTQYDTIDYKWNDRVTEMARERCELDHALSWLSTLGGAFSALGDYFERCALIAGKISMNQLRLAFRLGDPTVASRCKLYFSLSLIQQRRFKLARRLVYGEFQNAKSSNVVDHRLVKMCMGIWAKLQYEYSVHKSRKKINRLRLDCK